MPGNQEGEYASETFQSVWSNPRNVRPPGQWLDVSLCDSELVKELGLQGEWQHFFLTTQEKKDSAKSGLELKLTTRVWSVDCLNISSCSIPVSEDVKGWPHLSNIDSRQRR